jgi:CheY-like chemotaxis protein
MRLLVIEDHTDTRSLYSVLLNRCGCQTVAARNVQQARDYLDHLSFDIIVCDLNLPDADGIEVMRYAKERQPVRAIAVTGRAGDKVRQQALEAGFDEFPPKPVDFHELRRAIGLPQTGSA